jgi:predicted RNA-binding protein with PUA-like domain
MGSGENVAKRYWLMKSEPDAYSFEDLEREGITPWDGIRNYQARNLMRDEMKVGDGVLFYHSRVQPMAVVGLAKVAAPAHPDPTQFDPKSKYHDPKSDPEDPRWVCVDVAFDKHLPRAVTLKELKSCPELEGLMLLQRGARLSIQPVSAEHWKFILALAKKKPTGKEAR